VDDAPRLGHTCPDGELDTRLAGPGGQGLLAEYWVFRNLDAITRECWVLVKARVLELLSRTALLKWHGSLLTLR